MASETSLPLPPPATREDSSETAGDSSRIYTILILIGMLLVAVSLIFLWSELTTMSAPDACLFL